MALSFKWQIFTTLVASYIKSLASTPQQNGVVERKNQHLLSIARALLFQASLLLKFWGDDMLSTTHLINIIPILQNKSLYKALISSSPSYSHLRVFGCLWFASTLKNNRSKLSPLARKCIFIGYPSSVKGYKVYDLEDHSCFVSRDVIFYESSFSFQKSTSAPTSHIDSHNLVLPMAIPKSIPFIPRYQIVTPSTPIDIRENNSLTPLNSQDNDHNNTFPSSTENSDPSSHTVTELPPSSLRNNSLITLRISNRTRQAPGYLHDYHCQLAHTTPNSHLPPINTAQPLHQYLSYNNLPTTQKSFVPPLTLHALKLPRSC